MAVWDSIRDALYTFGPSSVVDILSIAVLIYLGLLLLKGTTAMSVLRGIVDRGSRRRNRRPIAGAHRT